MATNGSMCLDEKKKRSRVAVSSDESSKSKKGADRSKSPRLLSDDEEFQNAAPPPTDQLVEELKGEMEKLEARVRELEKQVDEKAELEIEVEILKEQVDELTESVESLEDLNQVLTVQELQHNDELQEARKVLIQEIGEIGESSCTATELQEIGESSSKCLVGIKRMGELHSKPFCDALKDICSSSSEDRFSDQSVLLCNFWEQMLKDPLWHPFKVALVDGKHQELLDEEDKLLKGLKNAWGEEAYSTVVNALLELNEHNPNGRYPVQELWNFKENRRATVNEGVAALAHRLRMYNPNGRYPVQELWNFEVNRRATVNEGVEAIADRLRMYHPTNTTTRGRNLEKTGKKA